MGPLTGVTPCRPGRNGPPGVKPLGPELNTVVRTVGVRGQDAGKIVVVKLTVWLAVGCWFSWG